jgi:Lon protease-like protein
MTYKLPLFPLNTVLFPGMPISLHIFEERYRLMIGRCIEQNGPFGVVLIREGREVGGEAAPYPVGTTAAIGSNVRLDDGRYYLTATGQRRFRIQYFAQRQPYLLASVV